MGKSRKNANKRKKSNVSRLDTSKKNEEVKEPQQDNINKQHNNGESQTDTPKWYRNVSIILSVLAISISIATMSINIIQMQIQNRQYFAQRNENQPVFQIDYKLIDNNNDSKADTEIFETKNIGREATSIEIFQDVYLGVRVNSKEHYFRDVREGLFPIEGYFKYHIVIYKLSGTLLSDSIPNNYKSYKRFIEECESKEEDEITFRLYKIVTIHYEDIYHDYHKVVIQDGKQGFSSVLYFLENNSPICNNKSFNLDTLKYEDIKEYILEEFKWNTGPYPP